MNKDTVRSQFNVQAAKFSKWSITHNQEYMQRYYDFCRIESKDTLLDVACGTGEFSIFCAKRIKSVCGIDISEMMIKLAKKHADESGLDNVSFFSHDVLKLPFDNNFFSIVISKSAFHHFDAYKEIIHEMRRCCRKGGKISIQDIVAYDNKRIDNYFEKIEHLIDCSHHKALSANFLKRLCRQNKIELLSSHVVQIDLNLNEYINHAVQTNESRGQINELITYGLNDKEIHQYFIEKKGELYFRRNVFLILGKKL